MLLRAARCAQERRNAEAQQRRDAGTQGGMLHSHGNNSQLQGIPPTPSPYPIHLVSAFVSSRDLLVHPRLPLPAKITNIFYKRPLNKDSGITTTYLTFCVLEKVEMRYLSSLSSRLCIHFTTPFAFFIRSLPSLLLYSDLGSYLIPQQRAWRVKKVLHLTPFSSPAFRPAHSMVYIIVSPSLVLHSFIHPPLFPFICIVANCYVRLI